MFSVITIKQLENTLVLFKKDKISEKKHIHKWKRIQS